MNDPIRFHLSLNVANLDRSVQFFRTLFGLEPAKLRADYAKFEPAEPPLVLSLEPARTVNTGGALNHLGFRMPDARSLVAMQERLERAGLRTRREEGVECCYARQTKFWAHDPDGNLWEVYTFDGDIEHRGPGQAEEVIHLNAPDSAPQAWEHRMNEPIPERIPHADGTLDEVRLRGTLNLPMSPAAQQRLVAEAARALKPGGRLFVHVLAGESAVEAPSLPGPAGAVQYVPQELDPPALLTGAKFENVRLLKFDSKPCFVRNSIAMREMQLEGFAAAASEGESVEVLYRGPFRELRDDSGHVFERGIRTRVPAAIASRLRTGAMSGQFTIFDAAATPSGCST